MSDIKLACTVVEQVKSLCDQHGAGGVPAGAADWFGRVFWRAQAIFCPARRL